MGMHILKFQEGNVYMQISSNGTFIGHGEHFVNADFFQSDLSQSREVYILNEILQILSFFGTIF